MICERKGLRLNQNPVHPIQPQSKIRKVLISDWNKTSHAMDSETALAYLTLTGQLSAAVENAEMFKIVALMSLFNGARTQSAADGELAKGSVPCPALVDLFMYSLSRQRVHDLFFTFRGPSNLTILPMKHCIASTLCTTAEIAH